MESKRCTENTAGTVRLTFPASRTPSDDPADVTSTLTKLIIDGISSHSTLLDSYVVLHGTFVSALHKLVGIDFGMPRLLTTASIKP